MVEGCCRSAKRRFFLGNCIRFLQEQDLVGKFDGIAARGMSGITIAAPLADALGKDLVIVRKGPTVGMSGNLIDFDSKLPKTKFRWIALDDWISSGGTMKDILTKCKGLGLQPPVAALLYYSQGSKGSIVPKKFGKVKIETWLPPFDSAEYHKL